jgi:hypothetical protein
VLHFETVGLQLYMMFLAFCVQFGEPQAMLVQSLCFSISNTYIVCFLGFFSGTHHMDWQVKQLFVLPVCFATNMLVLIVDFEDLTAL